MIHGFTFDVVAKCGFGISTTAFKGEESDFIKNARDVFASFTANTIVGSLLLNFFGHFPIIFKFIPLWPKGAIKIKAMTSKLIEDRKKKNIEIGDFVDRLKYFKANLPPLITSEMIDAQGMIFLTAGYETTANTIGSVTNLGYFKNF